MPSPKIKPNRFVKSIRKLRHKQIRFFFAAEFLIDGLSDLPNLIMHQNQFIQIYKKRSVLFARLSLYKGDLNARKPT